MGNSTSVDIVIPTFNGMKYLPDAVSSVLNQTYRNFSLYIVDDGSTDGTSHYAASLKDKRVYYLKKINEGVSFARNFGLTNSRSPLIAFLDSDDIWYPHKLEQQITLMESDPELGLVYGSHHIIDSKGIKIGFLEARHRGWIFEELLSGNLISGSASMALVKREALEQVGFFRTDLINGEDWELWMRISQYFKIDYVPHYLAAIRVTPGSAQKKYFEMAISIKKLLPIVLREYKLTKNQRKFITYSVLMEAAIAYKKSGNKLEVFRALASLYRRNPQSLFYIRSWSKYIFLLFGLNKGILKKIKALFSGGPHN